jgi:hypothetical protein
VVPGSHLWATAPPFENINRWPCPRVPTTPLVDRLLTCWRGIAAPENLPFHRLFFEIFGQAAHNPCRFDEFLTRVGHDWTNQVATALRAEGVRAAPAAGLAPGDGRLWRLRFELISIGDHEAVTASYAVAAAAFVRRCRAAFEERAPAEVRQPAS